MKKRLLTLILAVASAATAQTATISISLQVQPSVQADIIHHYLLSVLGPLGTTTAPFDATTTSVTLQVDQTKLSVAAPTITVGSAVVLDSEPMIVAAVSVAAGVGIQVTLTRGISPLFPLAAHVAGAPLSALTYVSPWAMLKSEALAPWIMSIISGLGSQSATLASSVTGTVVIQ